MGTANGPARKRSWELDLEPGKARARSARYSHNVMQSGTAAPADEHGAIVVMLPHTIAAHHCCAVYAPQRALCVGYAEDS